MSERERETFEKEYWAKPVIKEAKGINISGSLTLPGPETKEVVCRCGQTVLCSASEKCPTEWNRSVKGEPFCSLICLSKYTWEDREKEMKKESVIGVEFKPKRIKANGELVLIKLAAYQSRECSKCPEICHTGDIVYQRVGCELNFCSMQCLNSNWS